MPDDAQPDNTITVTDPPVTAADGTPMLGKYPANHRLRAEALVAEGATSDPDGEISDDLIADTAARLALPQDPPAEASVPSISWSKADLLAHARDAGVAVADTDTKAVILDAINAASTGANGNG